jgi:hypothetical protein
VANKKRKTATGSKAKQLAARQPAGRLSDRLILMMGGLVVLGIVLGVIVLVNMSSPQPVTLEKGIVGKWVNSKGGEVNFDARGGGMIPAGPDVLTTTFTYVVRDDTHVVMNLNGQTLTVTIGLTGDKMTWFTADPNTKYEYIRAK